MKKVIMLLAVAAIAVLITGCAGTKVAEIKFKHFEGDDQDQIETIGRQYGELLLESIKTCNYEMFCQNMTTEARGAMTLKLFTESCEKMVKQNGSIGEATYLGNMRPNPLMRNFLWKIEFEKPATNPDAPSKSIIYDRLFNVSIVKVGDEYQIIGFLM